jgi:hypothetical protein
MSEAISALVDAQPSNVHPGASQAEAAGKIAECNRKLAQCRRSRRPVSPATVAAWIAETEAEKAKYELGLRPAAKARERMTEQEIRSVVEKLGDIARVLREADTDEKSEIFRQLGLKLTYHARRRFVGAGIEPAPHEFSRVSEDQGLPVAHGGSIALIRTFVLGGIRWWRPIGEAGG